MLVKIKQTEDGRWRIRALGGEHYGQDLGTAKAVLLQRAKFGYENLTGLLIGAWDLEVYRHLLGTKTCHALCPRTGQTPKLPATANRFEDEAGWFESEEAQTPLHEVGLILANGKTVTYEKEVGQVKVTSIKAPSPQGHHSEVQAAKRKGVIARWLGGL